MTTLSKWLPSPHLSEFPKLSSLFLATVHVGHLMSQIFEILKGCSKEASALLAIDSRRRVTWPRLRRNTDPELVVTLILSPLRRCYTCRMLWLVLHRHKLHNPCVCGVRSAGIDECVVAASDTVQLLLRTVEAPPSSPESNSADTSGLWWSHLSTSTSAMLCTHIWRCCLFLCFRGQ